MWDHWGKTWKPSPANLSASALYTSTCATCFYIATSQAQRLPWWFKDGVRWQRICEGPNKNRADLELSMIQCHGLMHLVRMSMTFLRFLDICWWIIFCATPELVTVAFPEFSSLSVKGIFLGKLCVFLLDECVAPKVVTDIRSACKLLARSRRTPPCLMSWVPTQPTPQSYTLWIFCIAHVHLLQGHCLFMFVQYGWEGWAFVQCVCPWCKSHHGSSDAPVQGYDFLHMFWSIAAKNQIPDGKTRSAAEMSKLLVRMQPRNTATLHSVNPFISRPRVVLCIMCFPGILTSKVCVLQLGVCFGDSTSFFFAQMSKP